MANQKIVNGSPEWRAQRALGVGGSDAGAMYNEGWGCYRRLIMDKRGVEPDYQRPKREEEILERGNELEDIIADKFARESRLSVRRQPSRVSKTHPHARVNMDRQIVNVDEDYLLTATRDERSGISPIEEIVHPGEHIGPGVLECKSINEWDFKRLMQEGFGHHRHYVLQLQHAMAVTGYKWGAFAFLEPTWWNFRWFAMARNDALCAALLDKSEETWDLVEITSKPLPAALPDGDKRCKNCLYRKSCRGDEYLEKYAGANFESDYTPVEDPALVELAADYKEASEAAERADSVKKAIQDRIKEQLAQRELSKAQVPGIMRFCWTASNGRKTWDGKALLGEINAMRKVEDEQIQEIASRIANCQKTGKPSRAFRTYPE